MRLGSLPAEIFILGAVLLGFVVEWVWEGAARTRVDRLESAARDVVSQWPHPSQWDEVRSQLKELVFYEPALKTALARLDPFPSQLSLDAYRNLRDGFDAVQMSLDRVDRRQTMSFQSIRGLFFLIALVTLGALWGRQQYEKAQSRKSVQIQAQERWRVARELHDGVAQDLARAWLSYQELGCHHPDLADSLETSLKEIRWLCGTLRRAEKGESLDQQLDSSLAAFSDRYPIPLEVMRICPLGTGWSENLSHEILRIVQEALVNAARHSQTPRLIVRTLSIGPNIEIQVEDQGIGMSAPEGFGRKGMRERAELIGAELRWDAVEPQGTKVSLKVPRP